MKSIRFEISRSNARELFGLICLVLGVFLGIPLALTVFVLATRDTPEHIETFVSRAFSPDDKLEALVLKVLDSDGAFTTTLVDAVSVRSAGGKWSEDVLYVDDSGGPNPAVGWTDDSTLVIDLPNLASFVGRKREVHGIKVELRFHPNDPEARRKWRKTDGVVPRPLTDEAR